MRSTCVRKKILIGVCDIGNGHINRQICIIDELLRCNVKIVLAITKNSLMRFEYLYPQLKKVLINIPWICCDNNGINFKNTLIKCKNTCVNQYESFWEFGIKVQEAFGGEIPDIIMSDYEPNVAQYAYAIDKPLLCMEQQSKLLFIESEKVNDITVKEEIARLNYFFPKVSHRFLSSFFPLEKIERKDITILPPILKEYKKKKINEKKVVVYFSPYTNDNDLFVKVLEMVRKEKSFHFYLYSNLKFQQDVLAENITLKKISDEFKEDLLDCNFIISSSGHQLISEAINLETPLLLYCFNTYEQNYNSKKIVEYNIGAEIKKFDSEELSRFVENVGKYRENIKSYKAMFWHDDWKKVFMNKMKELFDIFYEFDYVANLRK